MARVNSDAKVAGLHFGVHQAQKEDSLRSKQATQEAGSYYIWDFS